MTGGVGARGVRMQGEQDAGGQPSQAQPGAVSSDADPSDLWAASLEAWVCSLNVERFRALLATATDPHQRAILTRLIGEHEARFRRFLTSGRPDAQSGEQGG